MSFRKYGGIQFNAHNNYVRSKVSDAGSLNITDKIGEFNSKVICESHLDLAGSSLLNVGNVYYSDGSSSSGTGSQGPPGPPGPTGPPGETGAAILANTQEFTGSNTFSAKTTFLAKTEFDNVVDITNSNNIKVNGNIIMNGVSGTNGNYLQFPDGTTQNTAAATPDNVAILENNQEFTGINTFTKNNVFSGNNSFGGNNTFNSANNFNGANIFSVGNTFSTGNNFLGNNRFSGNNTFTVGNTFSGPNSFNGNNIFTVGNTFSGPNSFSGNNIFSSGNTFSGDNSFSGTNTYTGENTFKEKTTFKNDVDIKDSYNINVNGNIIMNGASGTNGKYLQFPDGSQQITAYTGSTGGDTAGVAMLAATSQTFSGVNTFSNTDGGIKVAKMNLNNEENDLGTLTINSDSNFEISSSRKDANNGGDLILKSGRSLLINGGNPDGDGIAITTGFLYLDITNQVDMRLHKNTDGVLKSTFWFGSNNGFAQMNLNNSDGVSIGTLLVNEANNTLVINSSNSHDLYLSSGADLYLSSGNGTGATVYVTGNIDMSGFSINNVQQLSSVNDLNLKSGINLILTAGTTEGNEGKEAFALVAGNASLRLNTNDKSYVSIAFDTNDNYSRMKLYNNANGEKGYLAIILNSGSEDLCLESVNNLYLKAGLTSNNSLTISGTNISLNSTNNYIRMNNSLNTDINFGFPVDNQTDPIGPLLTFYKDSGSKGGGIYFNNSDANRIGNIFADAYQNINLNSLTGGITLTSKVQAYSITNTNNSIDVVEWTDGTYTYILFQNQTTSTGTCYFNIANVLNVDIVAAGGGGDGSFGTLYPQCYGGGGGGGGGLAAVNAKLNNNYSPYYIEIAGVTTGSTPQDGGVCKFSNSEITIMGYGGRRAIGTNGGVGGEAAAVTKEGSPVIINNLYYNTTGMNGGNGWNNINGSTPPTDGGSTSNPNPYDGGGFAFSWGNGGGGGSSTLPIPIYYSGGSGGNGGIGGTSSNGGAGGGGGGGAGGGAGENGTGETGSFTTGSGGNGGNVPIRPVDPSGSYGNGGGGAGYETSPPQNQYGKGSSGCVLITILNEDLYTGNISMNTPFKNTLPTSNNYYILWNKDTKQLYAKPV